MNKCDDIYFDKNQNDLFFEDEQQANIYIQANDILSDIAKSFGIKSKDNLFTPFFPISSENCFIYRVLMKNPSFKLDQIHQNRLCKNEYGTSTWKKMTIEEKQIAFQKVLKELRETYNNKILDTGYLSVKHIIQDTINNNKLDFINRRIKYFLKNLDQFTSDDDIYEYIKSIEEYVTLLNQCSGSSVNVTYNRFWKKIKRMVSAYVGNIIKSNIKIVKNRTCIDFGEFDSLHSSLQGNCMNFITLNDRLATIPEYPANFISNIRCELIDKILDIYNQLLTIQPTDVLHIRPTNLLQYLIIIKTYAPQEFTKYAINFLHFSKTAECNHFTTYQNDLLELLLYVIENITENMNMCLSIIATILINKQQYIQSKYAGEYFAYLVRIKKLLKPVIEKLNIYSAMDILYEVTNKNISLYFGTNSVTNIYRQDIDHVKVNNLLDAAMNNKLPTLDVVFESKIMDSIVKKIPISI